MNDRIKRVRSAADGLVVWGVVYQLETLCCRLMKYVGIGRSGLKMEPENFVIAEKY